MTNIKLPKNVSIQIVKGEVLSYAVNCARLKDLDQEELTKVFEECAKELKQ